ncbi:hypothetical protein V2A60_009817 [Cordyceps javanica]
MDTGAPRHGSFRALGIERYLVTKQATAKKTRDLTGYSISYRVPDSFFPLEETVAPLPATDSSTSPTQRWSNHFQGPRARTQLRAWSRVEFPSQSARNFSGTIMKRVGFPIPHDMNAPTIPLPVAQNPIELPVIAADGMPTRRVVRRLDSYKPSEEEWHVKGRPLTRLDMAGLQMQAQADVAHCLRGCPTGTTLAEARQRRAGHYVQIVPLKRRIGTVSSAGNRLRTYMEVLKLSAATSNFRVPSRRFSVLPRPQAASPALSPIALFTPDQEPVTPAAVMEPPRCVSNAKSPTKRSPRHKSPPIKNEGPRISEPAVKLLPATTPKIEPSPIKPASPPPATPLRETRRLRSSGVTPSTFPKSAPFGTAFAGMQRHSALRLGGAASLCFSPARLLTTPCPSHLSNEPSMSQTSPAKRSSSVMETPSRPVATEPMTPRIFTDISMMTNDVPSPVAFVSRLFPDSPVKQPIGLPSSTPQKPADFDFGTTSPAFNSVTWLNNVEAVQRPVASLKKGSRRQSEPLIRGCLRAQGRRQTLSPQKLVFKAGQLFTQSKGQSLNRRQTLSSLKLMPQAETRLTGSDGLFSPVKKDVQPIATASGVKFSGSPRVQKSQKPRRSLDMKTSPATRQPASEVVNIDMRQNPDIFGTKAVTLSVSPVLAAALPSIIESGPEMDGPLEPAELQQLSPSVEIGSRRDAEKSTSARAPVEVEETAVRDGSLSPVVDSPMGGLGIFAPLPVTDSPQISIEEHDEVTDTEPNVITQSPSPVTSVAASTSPKEQKLSPSPTLNLSFTPVNSRSPNAAEANAQLEESIPESPPTVTEIIETVTAQSHDYDSPGRDYMREFIRRSRPKRPSTTEAGSPVGLAANKRQPLGPKSPNTESPSKNKRKLEKEHDQHESPLKRTPNASPRKIRRYGKNFTHKVPIPDEDEGQQTETLDLPVATASEGHAGGEEDNAGVDSTSRRSSRLRNQTRLPSAKSAIPTPIKIGRGSTPTLNSAVRSVQQDLTNQTRTNTRKNRGNAEYPAQFLAKQSEEAQAEPELVERESSSEKEGRKCVNWSNPLAMYQEDLHRKEKDASKKAKTSKSKTVQMSGIAKPATRAKTTADKERTARLAEHFGMVSNGTPAKPQRSTRSRMRI